MRLPRSLPNQLTIARLVLALALFAILHAIGSAQAGQNDPAKDQALVASILGRQSLLLNLGAAIFVLAAISDTLDGQIARRWNLTTDFGRIADPFADKLIVSGAFIFLVPIAGSGVSAWMAALIVARESLVDGIRGFAESRGIVFHTSVWGKTKMVAQSVTVSAILLELANAPDHAGMRIAVQSSLAFTIFVTLFSGLLYVFQARTLLKKGARGEGGGGAPPSSVAEKVASREPSEAETSR